MSGRIIDNSLRLLGLVLIGVVLLFLLTPIFVTVLMAFDSREYLGPLPPPSFSLRWFHSSCRRCWCRRWSWALRCFSSWRISGWSTASRACSAGILFQA